MSMRLVVDGRTAMRCEKATSGSQAMREGLFGAVECGKNSLDRLLTAWLHSRLPKTTGSVLSTRMFSHARYARLFVL